MNTISSCPGAISSWATVFSERPPSPAGQLNRRGFDWISASKRGSEVVLVARRPRGEAGRDRGRLLRAPVAVRDLLPRRGGRSHRRLRRGLLRQRLLQVRVERLRVLVGAADAGD